MATRRSRTNLSDDVLYEFVHGEREIGAGGEHLPQLFLIRRGLKVSVQIVPHHVEEHRVVVHRLGRTSNKNNSILIYSMTFNS